MKARELLLYLSIKFKGEWDLIYDFIKKKNNVDSDEVSNFAKNFKYNYITLLDEEYPISFKNSRKPPFVLYYEGDATLLNVSPLRMLAVIGSRNCSKYGEENCKKIINDLSENIIIISGLAKGIDGIAHEAALNSSKKTIGVLGTAINHIYPKENEYLYKRILKDGGLIISEYGPEIETGQDNFLQRNRIIACLCGTLFVVESYLRSGCNSTISCAIEENRTICCLPYLANKDSNCNKLLKQGAYLVETAKDIEEILKP